MTVPACLNAIVLNSVLFGESYIIQMPNPFNPNNTSPYYINSSGEVFRQYDPDASSTFYHYKLDRYGQISTTKSRNSNAPYDGIPVHSNAAFGCLLQFAGYAGTWGSVVNMENMSGVTGAEFSDPSFNTAAPVVSVGLVIYTGTDYYVYCEAIDNDASTTVRPMLIKYNSSWTFQWGRWLSAYPTTSGDNAVHFTISGSFSSFTLMQDNTGQNFYVTKHDSSGNLSWQRRSNSGTGNTFTVSGMWASPSADNLYVHYTIPGVTTDIVRYSSVGTRIWGKNISGAGFLDPAMFVSSSEYMWIAHYNSSNSSYYLVKITASNGTKVSEYKINLSSAGLEAGLLGRVVSLHANTTIFGKTFIYVGCLRGVIKLEMPDGISGSTIQTINASGVVVSATSEITFADSTFTNWTTPTAITSNTLTGTTSSVTAATFSDTSISATKFISL